MLVGYFEEAEQATVESRRSSEQCRDYYDHVQFTRRELEALRKRGQAPVIDNFVQRKVDTLCGLERRARTDPSALPRNPDDEQAADAATEGLRYVADQNRFNALRSEVFNDILVEGTGGAEVIVEQKPNKDIMVTVKRVPWDRIWYDPHSRALDFEDAAYKGIVIWQDAADVRRQYPDRADAVSETLSTSASNTYDDRPNNVWCDSKRKRIRIVQCHYLRDGEWWVATYTKCGFLVDPEISPYKDKFGESACQLILRSGFIDRENNRYGHAKGLLSLQDEINKRRSKALHLLSQRQTFGNATAVTDVQKTKTEMAKPDGHVEINGGAKFGEDFGVLPTGDMAQGQVLMYQQAMQSMNSTGANSALQGKDERAPSGVALQTKIQAGATELEPQNDGLREWAHQIYEAMWMRIRQFWTGEKWIRVTDDDRNMKWVGLNKQVTLSDKLKQMEPQQAQQLMQQLGIQDPNDPRLQQVVEVENDVSGLDVDLVVDEVPDMATLQAEQFQVLAQLAGAPSMQGQIPAKALIEASSLRHKDKILDAMEEQQKANAQSQQQAQQMAAQAAQAETSVELQNKQSATDLNKAKTEQILVATRIDGLTALDAALKGQLSPPPPQPAAGSTH